MKQLYFFAVIGAGVFTFLPGRHMHDVLFGGSRPWLGVLAIALVALAAGVMLWKSVGAGLRGARQNSAGK